MKRILQLLALVLLAGPAFAQSGYEAATIPKELLPYASAVVRKMEERTEVKDLNNTIEDFKIVVTILNKNGDEHADIVVPYDKSNRIKFIKGVVYDEYGKPLKKFSESNFNDYSYGDGFSLFTDSRLKHFQPAVVNYPYTIEYEYQIASKQSLHFTDWRPNLFAGTAVESSRYEFVCKPDFKLHYKTFNFAGKVETGTNPAGMKTYAWEVKNLKATRNEPYSPDYEQVRTVVKFAPEKFYYEGVNGSFTNWAELGKWQYDNLLKSRTALPPETVSYIKSLTDTIKDPKRKAKAIYEYMQGRTRYVSIQVGIGGFQPFLASDVDKLNYGDCKALVNYTQSLLKAANIDSYYCIVHAGSEKKSLLTDFASMAQANHVILCIPFKNDTTWLECTSQKIPFGYLGDFTDDRWVLACTPEGGKLLHTPKYTAEQNRQVRIAKLTLKETGAITGDMTTTFEGAQYENRDLDDDKDTKKELEKLQELYPINNLQIETFNYTRQKDVAPVNKEIIKFSAADYAVQSSGTYYLVTNVANRTSGPPRELRTRTTDVYINRGYTDVDEVTYTLPAGYAMQGMPMLVEIKKPFGTFKASAMMNSQHQLVYKREIKMIDGTYPKESYQELVDFYKTVANADSYKVALAKRN